MSTLQLDDWVSDESRMQAAWECDPSDRRARLFRAFHNDPINRVDPDGMADQQDDTISTDYVKGLGDLGKNNDGLEVINPLSKYFLVWMIPRVIVFDSPVMISRGIRQTFAGAKATLDETDKAMAPNDKLGHLAVGTARVFTYSSEPVVYGSFLLGQAGQLGPLGDVPALRPVLGTLATAGAVAETGHIVATPLNQLTIEDFMDAGTAYIGAWHFTVSTGGLGPASTFALGEEGDEIVILTSESDDGLTQLGMNGGGKLPRGRVLLRDLLTPAEQAEFNRLKQQYPDWMPPKGLDTTIRVRSVAQNKVARSQFLGKGHHPQPLKFGGDPNPPDLVQTGETRTTKNPVHTEITNFWNKVLRRLLAG